MRPWVVLLGVAAALVAVGHPAPARAGDIAGGMANLPPDLRDIEDNEYIGIRIRRSTGLLALTGPPRSEGNPILPTHAFGKPIPTLKDLKARGEINSTTGWPSDPKKVPVYSDEQGFVHFSGRSYNLTIPTTAAVDAVLGITPSSGSTRQAINLEFYRKDKDTDPKPGRTQELYALLVDDTSSQTINTIVPRPSSLAKAGSGSGTTGGVVYVRVPVYIPYYRYVHVPVAKRACGHGFLGHCFH